MLSYFIFCNEVMIHVHVTPKSVASEINVRPQIQSRTSVQDQVQRTKERWLSKIEISIRKICLFLSALFEQIVPVSKSPLNCSIYI